MPAPERALESRVRELGGRIAAGQARAGRSRTRVLEDRGMELLSRDPALKAALFRLVDVAPACSGPREVAAHLASLLGEVERPLAPVRRAARRPVAGRVAGLAVQRMATRFIVGEAPAHAVGALRALWDSGAAASVDLLGEATVTAAEADRYARRCDEAPATRARACTSPVRPRPAATSSLPRWSTGCRPARSSPNYLLQFVEPRVVTEDTMRHGLVV